MDEEERRDKWRSVALVPEQRLLRLSRNIHFALNPSTLLPYWFLCRINNESMVESTSEPLNLTDSTPATSSRGVVMTVCFSAVSRPSAIRARWDQTVSDWKSSAAAVREQLGTHLTAPDKVPLSKTI